jgi:hypothetical protein
MMPEPTQEALRQRQARQRRADKFLSAGVGGILAVLVLACVIANYVAVETILSVLAGGLITWYVSWRYYKKAGDELRHEASELSAWNTLLSRGLEEAGLVTFTRDPSGKPTGVDLHLAGSMAAKPTLSGTLTTEGSRPSGESESHAPEGGGLSHGAGD